MDKKLLKIAPSIRIGYAGGVTSSHSNTSPPREQITVCQRNSIKSGEEPNPANQVNFTDHKIVY